MSDQFVTLPSDISNTGKKIDNTELVVGTNVVERQRINLADATDPAGFVAVVNAIPGSATYGVVVRPLLTAPIGTASPTGSSIPISVEQLIDYPYHSAVIRELRAIKKLLASYLGQAAFDPEDV